MENGILGALLDNVTLNGALATSTAPSEYQSGGAKSWSATVDYAVAAEPRATALPGWFTRVLGDLPPWISESELGRSIRNAAFRWNPAQIRFTTRLAKSSDDRRTFLKPASAYDDSGRVVTSQSNLWRNNAAIELRPVGRDAALGRDFDARPARLCGGTRQLADPPRFGAPRGNAWRARLLLRPGRRARAQPADDRRGELCPTVLLLAQAARRRRQHLLVRARP